MTSCFIINGLAIVYVIGPITLKSRKSGIGLSLGWDKTIFITFLYIVALVSWLLVLVDFGPNMFFMWKCLTELGFFDGNVAFGCG